MVNPSLQSLLFVLFHKVTLDDEEPENGKPILRGMRLNIETGIHNDRIAMFFKHQTRMMNQLIKILLISTLAEAIIE